MNLDLVNHPDDAAKPENAVRIAVDFWDAAVVKRGVQTDVAWTSRIINGGTNGLTEREAAAATWERKLDAGYRPGQPDPTEERATADRREFQAGLNALGYTDARGRPLAVDGQDGPGTKAATEAFQRDRDLSPDGVAGPRTRAALVAALAETQTPSATASPTGSAAQSAVTSPLPPSAPLSPADQAAIDRGLRDSAGVPVPPSSLSTVITPSTTSAANSQVASAPTASELWSAVAARAPVASTTAASVVAVPAIGPSLGSR